MNVSKLSIALGMLLVLPLSIVAGTITFSDLTETPSIIDGTGGRVSGSCQGESCTVTLTAPAGFTFFSFNVNFGIWMEPGMNSISDTFCVPNVCTTNPTSVFVAFTSDGETSLPDEIGCLTQPGLCPEEDGTVQLAGQVVWRNSDSTKITDSFQFQSDVASVPEPASGPLALAGFMVLALAGAGKAASIVSRVVFDNGQIGSGWGGRPRPRPDPWSGLVKQLWKSEVG